MSKEDGGEGLAEIFVKGVVFTLGAAAAGVVLRRFGREREPEIVVVVAGLEDGVPGSDQAEGSDP